MPPYSPFYCELAYPYNASWSQGSLIITPSLAQRPLSGTVLAFDFGLKRIGVAVGDFELKMAHPLTTIEALTPAARLEKITALVKEWRPVQLVVGEPLHMDGKPHKLTLSSRRFAQSLAEQFKLSVIMVDERLSSYSANLDLNDMGVYGQRQKPYIDQLAAQAILQSYFNQDVHVLT